MINKSSFIGDLEDLLCELKEKEDLQISNEILKLEKAKYKAYFYGKSELAEKLSYQVDNNYDYLVGPDDGFSYSSIRAKAKFRTLEDMLEEGIITQKEYNFCID